MDESYTLLLRAIERVESALKLVDHTKYPSSALLIDRALSQMHADAWPDAIDETPASR